MIVAGFPGVGKTYAAKAFGAIDSDSSAFSWDESGVNRHPDWPDNYVDLTIQRESESLLTFVSTHEEVRQALAAAGVRFTLVYPGMGLRAEYVQRVLERGSTHGFAQFIESNWTKLIGSCQRQEGCDHVILDHGQYLSDVLPSIVAAAPTSRAFEDRS